MEGGEVAIWVICSVGAMLTSFTISPYKKDLPKAIFVTSTGFGVMGLGWLAEKRIPTEYALELLGPKMAGVLHIPLIVLTAILISRAVNSLCFALDAPENLSGKANNG